MICLTKPSVVRFGVFSLVLVSMLCLTSNLSRVKTQEQQPQQLTKQVEENSVLFFYRPDCGDCQDILPLVNRYSLFHRDVVYVNLNLSENRRYIKTYRLTAVPTFVKQNNVYQGTNKQKITHLLLEE